MKSLYELKRIKSSKDPDLAKALILYSKYTEPALRTDTREIIHWLDKFNKEFEDSFFVLGFYLNGDLVGFSEIAYFLKEKTVIVDYLVIDKEFRGNNTFYEFLENIRQFLIQENLSFDYIIAEVGLFYEKLEPPETSKHIIRLLKMSHFGVAKCNYYLPKLGISNHESEMRAIMMIYSENKTKQIKKETFFQIVNAIYFKYYQRWYNEFLEEDLKIQYGRGLHDLVAKMEKELAKAKFIEINGFHNLFPVQPPTEKNLTTKKIAKIIVVISAFIVCSFLVGAAYLVIKSKYGIDSGSLSFILITAGSLVLFISAMIVDNKSNFFTRMIEKIIDKL